MEKKTKSGLIVLICLIFFIFCVIFASIFNQKRKYDANHYNVELSTAPVSDSTTFDKVKAKNYSDKFIAALYIEGQISEDNAEYNQKWLLSTINKLKQNKKNVALAVYINSPGGAVYQADEVYLALQDYKTTGKLVYVYQGPMAASGGYYISCASDKIFANRNTLTGCIGVISGTTFDMTEFLENIGIKTETIHSGKNKNMMNFNEPFTDEQKQIMQSISDECYEQFVSIVAKARRLNYSQAEKLSDGRLYTAKQALELGLIDRIDSWDNMIEELSEEIDMPGIKLQYFKKEKKNSFVDYLTGKSKDFQNAAIAAKMGLPVSIIEQMNRSNLMPQYLLPTAK